MRVRYAAVLAKSTNGVHRLSQRRPIHVELPAVVLQHATCIAEVAPARDRAIRDAQFEPRTLLKTIIGFNALPWRVSSSETSGSSWSGSSQRMA